MGIETPGGKSGGPDRIIGIDKASERYLKVKQGLEILENQKLEPYEREKTPEETEIALAILKKLPDFLKEYGVKEEVFISLNQIHIIDSSDPKAGEAKSFLEEGTGGRYLPWAGRIEILPIGTDHLHMAHVLVHELMHANSFFSINAKTPGPVLRRFGLSVGERGTAEEEKPQLLFKFIDEALVEELTRRFCERYFPEIPLLSKSFMGREKTEIPARFMNSGIDNPLIAPVLKEILEKEPLYSYLLERIDFITLVFTIYKRNEDIFTHPEDVFKLFSQAAFNGNLLTVARLIEDTFGKGSLRKFGERTKKRPDKPLDIFKDL